MTDKRRSDLWRRLNEWVDGKEPEVLELPEETVHELRCTHELEQEYEERRLSVARKHNFGGKSLIERYSDWENGSGTLFFSRLNSVMAFLACVAVVSVMLLLTASSLPPFGDPANPANNEVFTKYIEDSLEDTNATNVVAGIILDYRAFDTFGEASVLFAAACAVIILLRRDDKKAAAPASGDEEEARQGVILSKVSVLVVPVLLLYGIYVILNGHISPGGGFSGGTIIGAGLILCRSAFGAELTGGIISARTYTRVTFSALIFYALAKGYSFFTGANHIKSSIPTGEPGAILSGGLILPLNIAVGLVVALTLYGFYSLYIKGEI